MSKHKLPTIAELRTRATEMGVDIDHLGRKKKEIKALLDAQGSLATKALSAEGTGTLDYASALSGPSEPVVTRPTPTKNHPPRKQRTKVKRDTTAWKEFVNGDTSDRKKEVAAIDEFLQFRNVPRKKVVHPEPPSIKDVPLGMTQVTVRDGYDPNKPSKRPAGHVGPRKMMCGHSEWWWKAHLGRCVVCLPCTKFPSKVV